MSDEDYGFCPLMTKMEPGGLVLAPCGEGCQLFISEQGWTGCSFKLIAEGLVEWRNKMDE